MSNESSTQLSTQQKTELYKYLARNKYSRLTIKILLGYNPDGMDRLTIALGKGTEYDYKLLDDPEFKNSELIKYLGEIQHRKEHP